MLKKIESLEKKYESLEADLAKDSVVADQQKYQAIAKEYSDLGPLIQLFREYKKIDQDLKDIEEFLADPDLGNEDKSYYESEKKELASKEKEIHSKLEDLLLEGEDPYKDRNIFIEVRAGTGGEEAALFASDIFRMYEKFAAKYGFKVEILSINETGIGGIKEVISSVSGDGCYRKFKYESGTHRVQRVPDTETSGRIHTSAITVAVLPEAEEVEVEINPEEIRIDTYRASGAGGQHVNKTESAIRITHLPTNLVVTCQDEKSQHKNKAKAMRILRTRLFEKYEQEQASQISADRKSQVGSGDRSQRIRTYNFPEKRVTDHRIGLTLYSLDQILEGELDELVNALATDEKEKKLSGSDAPN